MRASTSRRRIAGALGAGALVLGMSGFAGAPSASATTTFTYYACVSLTGGMFPVTGVSCGSVTKQLGIAWLRSQ